MATIQPFEFQDPDGNTYTVLIEGTAAPVPSEDQLKTGDDNGREEYGLVDDAKEHFRRVHGMIRAYSWYALGAFRGMAGRLPGTHIEEITLKFGMKIGGEAGLPVFTKGSVESNFEVEVKCKFPKDSSQNDG